MDQSSERADARRAPHGSARSPLSTGLRVFALGLLGGLIIIVAALLVLAPLNAGQTRADRVANEDLAIQRQSASLRATLVRWQAFLEPKYDDYQNGASAFAPADIATGSELAKTQITEAKTLASMLRARGIGQQVGGLDTASKSLTDAITALSPVASGPRLTPAQFARITRSERDAYLGLWDLASSINKDVSLHTTTPDVAYVADRFQLARNMTVLLGGMLVLLSIVFGAVMARRAARRQRAQQLEAQRLNFGSDLQQALELASNERAVYGVAGRALRETVPDLNVELLIADSSNAHFRRVFGSHDGADQPEGCGVVSPRDCPAAIRGHTMEFETSEAISACPHLQNRASGPCSAVCIPVSIMGSTVGVMHAVGEDGTLPRAGELDSLELSARRSAERIALLRAFDQSERQARTDPLTGLLNRRSLENEVREVQSNGLRYALAYGDLDHFKVLNDTFGHESGDQALRLFSRVMRDAVRPVDLVARYGGEEFVIVLPDCGTEEALKVLERIRERLSLALTSGRVPAFTVSFGLSTSEDGATLAEIVAAADRALLAAKTAGRDRVLIADTANAIDQGLVKVLASSTKVRTP